ncbi:hypothetical protein V2J09_000439 [Rumex salicifolius]
MITLIAVGPKLLFLFLPFLLSFSLSLSLQTCPDYYCPASDDGDGPQPPPIRFPFATAASGNHTLRCGYPGFHLTCNNRVPLPIISLASSGDFNVQLIDYVNQLIWISDPDSCLPNRILTLDLANSTFSSVERSNYTLLNCTAGDSTSPSRKAVPVPCLSRGNFTVYVTSRESTVEFMLGSGECRVIKSVWSPSLWPLYRDESGPDLGTAFIPLSWSLPNCGECERNGGVCGFQSDSGLDVECSVSISDSSRAIKFGLIVGLLIPGVLCTLGLAFYFTEKRMRQRRHLQTNTELSTSVVPLPSIVTVVGLDGRTIESYPKTLLGESRRLPNPTQVHCAICLSEYEPKEALRTIPECNHYFHADCIDEWLRMKGTCPLCRNSPGN